LRQKERHPDKNTYRDHEPKEKNRIFGRLPGALLETKPRGKKLCMMIDEVSDTLGWDRKHAIKAFIGKVSLGQRARKWVLRDV
jgi:hypothetical protein